MKRRRFIGALGALGGTAIAVPRWLGGSTSQAENAAGHVLDLNTNHTIIPGDQLYVTVPPGYIGRRIVPISLEGREVLGDQTAQRVMKGGRRKWYRSHGGQWSFTRDSEYEVGGATFTADSKVTVVALLVRPA